MNPQNTIADAFKKLKCSVSEEDAHKFASTELEDIASRHRDVFEALISAYADIGAALPRFDRYKKAFDDNVEFQLALAAVYTKILEFHQRAYKFLRRRAWHVIFLSLWKDFGSRFKGIIESLKEQQDFVDIEAASFNIVEAKESRIRMQQRQKRELEAIEEVEKNAKISRLQHSITWLTVDDRNQETEKHPEVCTLIANEFVYRGVIAYTRIVVDGIDQFLKEDQKAILKELQIICAGPATRCKVLFSSRREVQIREKLSKQPRISLDGRQEVDQDIQSYIKYKITKLHTSNQDLLNEIESILAAKANGMFLWVRLVVGELKYCYNDADLMQTAKGLPKGLESAYGRILERIMDPKNPERVKQMAMRILEWMACSYRVLKSYEIIDGIAFDGSNTTLTARTKNRREVLDRCRPLIEDGPSNTVEFVHLSAKEYILEESHQQKLPFVSRESAHLNISFSCITVLNSCIPLLPTYSTEAQRAAIIVQGFHGLLMYANMFWYMHLLEYCKSQRQLSTELLSQLQQLLLHYRKENMPVSDPKANARASSQGPNLEALNHLPEIKRLISDILAFRFRLNLDDISDKSPESLSLESCDMDPTYFSTIRHHYQQTAESLLDNNAQSTFPEIKQEDFKGFQNTFGPSAFVCRYLRCAFSTDGFGSPSERDKHESQHQRLFRCAYSSCVDFATGFATRKQLNNHNEKYHSSIINSPELSLAETLTASFNKDKDSAITLSPLPKELLPEQQKMRGLMLARWEADQRDASWSMLGVAMRRQEIPQYILPSNNSRDHEFEPTTPITPTLDSDFYFLPYGVDPPQDREPSDGNLDDLSNPDFDAYLKGNDIAGLHFDPEGFLDFQDIASGTATPTPELSRGNVT
ncbi:hypothetical protein NHQ30_010957 [Ciborinia camelliae]|nr:hypothetical protein NHQ30_010957 [Ciborinia camelliae]